MKLTVCLGPLCLSFRGSLDLATCRADPRGMSGTDYGTFRLLECLRDAGHQVTFRSVSAEAGTTWEGIEVIGPDATIPPCDAVIAINEPDLLRDAPPGAFRLCYALLNDLSFARCGIADHVDLWASPSNAHLGQFRTNTAWHRVQVSPTHPNGAETFVFDESKWTVVPLGCDPERLSLGWPHVTDEDLGSLYNCEDDHGAEHIAKSLGLCDEAATWIREWHTETGLPDDYEHERRKATKKVPGRVIYSSSPDRGLHWLLQEWPAIKAAVPHATLSIFYRLAPWLRGFDSTPHYPPIEPLRSRANYIEECLARFAERGGMGVTVRDSVSRDVIEKEMASAEVFAYPMQTTTWSEGFSCSTLEACAARACPITTDCDAFGDVYGETLPLTKIEGDWVPKWRDQVIRALTDAEFRDGVNEKARKLGESLTWKRTAESLVRTIEERAVK